MDIYTLTVICSISIAGRASFDSFKREHDLGNINPYMDTHVIGALISSFLAIAVLIYTFINFKWWFVFVVFSAGSLFAYIFLPITLLIFGKTFTRLLLIWLCPLVGVIYFIIKAI